ncbi:hypothetical protein BDZ94DRAFT_1257721 [Collybia nuda]|uniref:IRG-type G domain-containing protein n=1 Tax=Collybia nuda TaxID=64659 RepID=A0A9P5Y828_9AGAR|nr:hypothetical protein BDZ94DRAFT_1257721 [Collybia nuda]
MSNFEPGAAQVGVNVNRTNPDVTRHPDPRNSKCVWYDIPGPGTLNVPDWQYFKDQGFYMFDAVIILYAHCFTSTDVALLEICRNCGIPTSIVRSKSDQYIRNIRRDSGYDSDPVGYLSRFTPSFVRAEENARDKFINETIANVKKDLETTGLWPKRVYFVSRSAMMKGRPRALQLTSVTSMETSTLWMEGRHLEWRFFRSDRALLLLDARTQHGLFKVD